MNRRLGSLPGFPKPCHPDLAHFLPHNKKGHPKSQLQLHKQGCPLVGASGGLLAEDGVNQFFGS